jgi:photosystem II stability/assembly factor-like uncharacterized protein
MRTLSYFFAFLLLHNTVKAQTSEWQQINYSAYYYNIFPDYFFVSDIQMVNATIGYALGYNGTVMKTSDGGKTWIEKLNYLSSGNFRAGNDIFMVDENIGYLVGGTGTAYKTTDGFNSLVNLMDWGSPTQITERNLHGVHFIDQNKGFACAYVGGDILGTTNGGNTWRLLTPQENPCYDACYLTEMVFTSPDTGFVAGTSIQRTTDGGATWKIIYNKLNLNSVLNDIFFLNSRLGWAVGTNDSLLRTTDGGTTWSPMQLPVKNLDLFSIAFVSATEGVIWAGVKADGSSKVFRTENGGTTWTEEAISTGAGKYFMSGASFRNGNQWISIGVGYQGIIYRNCRIPKPTVSKVKSDLVSSYATGNQWYRNNVLIPGATGQKFNPTKTGNGSYTVKVRQSECYSPFSNPVIVGSVKAERATGSWAASIGETQPLQLFPNPASGILNIRGLHERAMVELFHVTGARVFSKSVNSEQERIDISRLSPGVYLAVIRLQGQPASMHKLVVQ